MAFGEEVSVNVVIEDLALGGESSNWKPVSSLSTTGMAVG